MTLAGLISLHLLSAQDLKKPIADSSAEHSNDGAVRLSEITLAATRFSQNRELLAQQVFSISRKNIEEYNQPTMAELLSQSGEVLVQKSQLGGGSPIIRGFEANKVLISVDGIRLNNAIYRAGHLQNVITLNDESMEKVEILSGPSSVMYGSDALGGVMSFYTRDPEWTAKRTIKASAKMRYASACEGIHLHAAVSAGGPKWAGFSSLSFSRFGDLRQGTKGYTAFPGWGLDSINVETIDGEDSVVLNAKPQIQTPSGYSQYDLVQKILFRAGGLKNTINLQFSNSSDIPRYDRLSEISNGSPKSAAWYYGPQWRLLAAWHIDLKNSRLFDKARVIPYFQKIKESRHNRNLGSADLKNRNEQVMATGLNADFSKKMEKSEWTYGAEIIYNKVNSSAAAQNIITGAVGPLDTRYPDGGSHTLQAGLYGSLIHKINGHWTLNSGLRGNISALSSTFNDTSFFPFPFHEIRQNNQSLTGNAGLIWLPGNGWKYSFLLASGFRTPNVDDLAKVFESTPGNLIVPNPYLKPERTFNYEAAITKNWRGRWQFNLCAWYTRYKDILTIDSGTVNGQSVILYDGVQSKVNTIVNKSRARLWGWNMKVDGQIMKQIFIHSSLHYTSGRITEPDGDYPLDHIPPVYGKVSLEARIKKMKAEFFTIFNGRKDSADYNLRGEDNQLYSADPIRGFTPSWSTLNMRLTLNFNELYSIQLACENITDKFYRTFASGLSGSGRNFILTLSGKFP